MIINEKYLQDIDDEDDDVVSSGSSNDFSNKKDLDYEFTAEISNDRPLLQYSYLNQKDETD